MIIEAMLLFSTLSLLSQEAKEPQEILQSFGADLQKAIGTAPKDPAIRAKLTSASKLVFDQEMRTAAVKIPKPRWEYHQQFVENLILAEKKYADENLKGERALWVLGCKSVFALECGVAKEAAESPTTDEVFEELWTAVGKTRKDFPTENSTDLRKAAYTASKQVFTERLKTARASGKDPQSSYADQLLKIDRMYPLPGTPPPAQGSSTAGKGGGSTPAKGGSAKGGAGGGTAPPPPKKEPDYNTEPNQLLKFCAKSTLDRALTAPK